VSAAGSAIVWDTCCLLNLLASGHSEEILAAAGCSCWVPNRVISRELLFLRPLPEVDPQEQLVPVEFSGLLSTELLEVVDLDGEEQALFVEYARALDDGEAAALAVAVARAARIATDDRAAIRLIRSLERPPAILTTPEWLMHWADVRQVDDEVVAEVLRRVETCARYRPPRDHPLQGWWNRRLSKD
jgi:hypothetical protein